MPDASPQRPGSQKRHNTCKHPGTVDADYRGEIGAILINLSDKPFTINDGERICQMVVTRYSQVEWEPAEQLEATRRGDGGFGHTGLE